MDSKEIVLNCMKESADMLKAGEIKEKTGLDEKVIAKAIKQLKTEGLIDSPKRCYYAPVIK